MQSVPDKSAGRGSPVKLSKGLGLVHVFCIATGAMIGSGLFVLPGLAHAQAGPAVFISYLLAGLLAIAGMLSQAELVSAMPKAGGTYFYVTRSLGPAVGTIDGVITWMSLCLKSAFALVGIAALAAPLLRIDNLALLSVPLCLLFVAVNVVGIKGAGTVQVVLVSFLVAILVLYVARGLSAVAVRNFEPLAPAGLGAVFSTAGLVFVSYAGLLKVASIAEEVKNPARTVPLAMIFSLLFATLLYVLVVFVTTGVLDPQKLDDSLTPVVDGAAAFMGSRGRIALGVAAVLAFVTTANAGIMAASRYPLAISRDGLLPQFLERLNARFKTPHFAILFTGAFTIVALFLKLNVLVKMASSVLILSYIFSCFSVVMLRESRVQNYQPGFRAPLYPWIQIAGVFGYALLLFKMGAGALAACSVPVASGLVLYFSYGRVRANRESALLHLVQRVTAKELVTGSLEAELKEIIRERDGIVADRFDGIIEKSVVLDLGEKMKLPDFLNLVARRMAPSVEVSQPVLEKLLVEREGESSTVLRPGLAIPHVVIAGEKTFDVLLARSREGILFSEDAPPVHSVFVLVGTKDERNFHLRALSAIAQIVQEPSFDRKWMSAQGEQALRDIVLLGKRRRI